MLQHDRNVLQVQMRPLLLHNQCQGHGYLYARVLACREARQHVEESEGHTQGSWDEEGLA